MARRTRGKCLFAPDKIEWMLTGGLETMSASERQMLLVMAETRLQEGYKPTNGERKAVERLRALAGDDYDAKDIRQKVKTLVKGRTKPGSSPLRLPPVLKRLLERFRTPSQDAENGAG